MTPRVIVDNRGFKERVARWLLRPLWIAFATAVILIAIANAGCTTVSTDGATPQQISNATALLPSWVPGSTLFTVPIDSPVRIGVGAGAERMEP